MIFLKLFKKKCDIEDIFHAYTSYSYLSYKLELKMIFNFLIL